MSTSASKSAPTGKDEQEIHVGDHVSTRFRGGHREGEVEAVYMNSTSTPAEGSGNDVHIRVQNPPKVVFTDQHGHQVSHNPGTLTHVHESE